MLPILLCLGSSSLSTMGKFGQIRFVQRMFQLQLLGSINYGKIFRIHWILCLLFFCNLSNWRFEGKRKCWKCRCNVWVLFDCMCIAKLNLCIRPRRRICMMMGIRCACLSICYNKEARRLFFQKSLGMRLEAHSKEKRRWLASIQILLRLIDLWMLLS